MPPRGEVSAYASEAWRGRPRPGPTGSAALPRLQVAFLSPVAEDPCQQW